MADARNGDVDAMDHHQEPAHRLPGQRAALMRLERTRLQNPPDADCRTITDGPLVHQHARGDVMFGMDPIADLDRTSRLCPRSAKARSRCAPARCAGARAERPAAGREDSYGEVARSTRSAHVLSACTAMIKNSKDHLGRPAP